MENFLSHIDVNYFAGHWLLLTFKSLHLFHWKKKKKNYMKLFFMVVYGNLWADLFKNMFNWNSSSIAIYSLICAICTASW